MVWNYLEQICVLTWCHFIKKSEQIYCWNLEKNASSLFSCQAKKRSPVLVSVRVASDPRITNLFCYETMSNCSQNCCIDWNSAVLCFKRLFHIGV